jgi:four helix bundle protein
LEVDGLTAVPQRQKTAARNYRDLIVWQEGIELAKKVYQLTEKFPRTETYALCDQLRRAAISVPSNIAEGQARKSSGDFNRFLHMALGSLAEVDTQLVLARELGYLADGDCGAIEDRILELRKKLYALINSLTG